MDTIKLKNLYNLKIYLIKYLATEMVLIKSIGIMYCIFIKQLTTTIMFINLLLLSRLTTKSIKMLCYFYIKIDNN